MGSQNKSRLTILSAIQSKERKLKMIKKQLISSSINQFQFQILIVICWHSQLQINQNNSSKAQLIRYSVQIDVLLRRLPTVYKLQKLKLFIDELTRTYLYPCTNLITYCFQWLSMRFCIPRTLMYKQQQLEMMHHSMVKQEPKGYILEIIVLVAMLTLTLKYRYDLSQSQFLNGQHNAMLLDLTSRIANLQTQQQQLQDYYHNNYEIVLGIVKVQLKQLRSKLEHVNNLYSLHNQLYAKKSQLQKLTLKQRITRIENILAEESSALEYIENVLKDQIKQAKFKKMDILANDTYFESESMRSNWQLLKTNIKSPFTTQHQLATLETYRRKQQLRLEQAYSLSKYDKQLPFCIIVPSYNNAKNFRYEFNLQSILNQQYSNYHVIIIDDASPDKTGLHIQRFLKKNKIEQGKVVVIRNEKQMTAVPNIHTAATKYCKADQIGFFVDGDDELVGTHVFKIFNAVYQSKQPAIAYSIAFEYWISDALVKDNWSQQYTLQQKQNNLYRNVPQKISHLRSFRIDLYLKIKEEDLKDDDGEWFTSTYDEVICLPMLEMSCGKIEVIREYLYLYMFGTGYNDRMVDKDLQNSIARKVKNGREKYQCDPRFAGPL